MVQKTCPNCLEPSPIACKRCRKCDYEFKKRADSEPVTVKKIQRKPLLSASQCGRPSNIQTAKPPPILPTITPEEKEKALFKEVNIVNKKCSHCSAPSPIACKRCRSCGGEFQRKGYLQSSCSPEPLRKRAKRAHSVQSDIDKETDKREESPELPVRKTKDRQQLNSIGTNSEQEAKLKIMYAEKQERLAYILRGINDKLTGIPK